MSKFAYLMAMINGVVAGSLYATLGPKYAICNLLVMAVICVDQLCEAIKEQS